MTENKILMGEARKALEGKWSLAAGGFFIYMLIGIVAGAPDNNVGTVLTVIVEGPLLLGLAGFALALARGGQPPVQEVLSGFGDFLRAFAAYIIVCLFSFLWTLLLIVPGIIAMLSYSQTFFILSQDKSINARQAINKSKAMMLGHKKKLFYLFCRFFGWFLLGILTLGIGFLWILPYFYVTLAKFYDEVSKQVA